MYFSEIRPFIRYAHYQYINHTASYNRTIPCDARLFFVSDGCIKIAVGSTEYLLSKGDALLINSGVSYHILAPDDSAVLLALNFDFTFSNATLTTPIPPMSPALFTDSHLIGHVTFEDMALFNEHCVIRGMMKIHTMLSKIQTEYRNKLLYHEQKESQLLAQALIEIARTLETPVFQYKKDLPLRILDYIHEEYSHALTNQQIAEVFNFHPNYINALIKSCTGMSLHAYLIHIRITYALDLLENSTLSISEIAEACGFCDIFHFSRCFKKKIGYSPTEYRRLQF